MMFIEYLAGYFCHGGGLCRNIPESTEADHQERDKKQFPHSKWFVQY